MKKYNYDHETAGDLVIDKRPIVCPNLGFIKQLQLYEKLKFQLEGDSPFHHKYHFVRLKSCLASDHSKWKEASLKAPFAGDSFICALKSLEQNKSYQCKQCKKSLFPAYSVLHHVADEDDEEVCH